MDIKRLSEHVSLLMTNHCSEVLYSREQPVAGFTPEIGWFVSTQEHTTETLGHIADYLSGISKTVNLTPEEIENMFLQGVIVCTKSN